MPKTIILIPSRMSASRLPGKPLLRINNLPIISHVVNKAEKSNIGRVVVCTEDEEILKEVKKNGGEAILTSSKHKSGSDRIFEAFTKLKINNVDYVLNLQGDEPNIDENDIINLNKLMIQKNSDMGTLATKIKEASILSDENVVKVVLKEKLSEENFPFALNFSRKDLSSKYENIYWLWDNFTKQNLWIRYHDESNFKDMRDKGKIIERGNHNELIEKRCRKNDLLRLQARSGSDQNDKKDVLGQNA